MHTSYLRKVAMCTLNKDCKAFKAKKDKCLKCCPDKLQVSSILPKEHKDAWKFIIDTIINAKDKEDIRTEVISIYILLPSLLRTSFRDIMLEHFLNNGVSTEALIKGKWLHDDLNINLKLIKSIMHTQNIKFILEESTQHFDAIDFFTHKSATLNRNKTAHNAVKAIKLASSIRAFECLQRVISCIHMLLCIEHTISKQDRLNRQTKMLNIQTKWLNNQTIWLNKYAKRLNKR